MFQCLLAAEVSRCLDKTLLCSVVLCEKDVKTEGRPWHLSRYSHLRAVAVFLFLSVSNEHPFWKWTLSLAILFVKRKLKMLSWRETFSFVLLWTSRCTWSFHRLLLFRPNTGLLNYCQVTLLTLSETWQWRQ